MTKKKSGSRRDFLRRSSVATAATLAGPGPLAALSGKKQGDKGDAPEPTVSKSGFPRYQTQDHPEVEEYATVEAVTNGAPVWSFSNLCYIYSVGPDLMPGLVMQQGNQHSLEKIKLKKAWEIKHNLCGVTSEMAPRTAYNDSLPFLPIHLIDGDPNTIWSSWGLLVPDGRPEWIRIDLPIESEVASVALVCAKNFLSATEHHHPEIWTRDPQPSPSYGKSLPKELEVKTSRDAWHWETVYSSTEAPNQPVVEIKFQPHLAKQIWIIGANFRSAAPLDVLEAHAFSIGSVEVRNSSGNNLALVSRGASVSVSSTSYAEMNDRFSQDALWVPLNCDLGNKWVRTGEDNGPFLWYFVERVKGKLELDRRADEAVSELNRYGINPIICLDFKGNWIYEQPPRKTDWLLARFREMNDAYNDPLEAADANPEMYQGYLRYIEYMARKLKDRVAYIEIGNEWHDWFPADHYVPVFFEPSYQIIKREWPEAKVMLGNPSRFDRNAILDCLGRQRQYGIRGGRLMLDVADVHGPIDRMWPNPERRGALAVREDIKVEDATVSVEAQNQGIFGILVRYEDVKNYLAAICSVSDHSIEFYQDVAYHPYSPPSFNSRSDHTIAFYEVRNGDWSKPIAAKKLPELGANLKLLVKVLGPNATFTVSDGVHSVSTECEVQRPAAGTIGLIQRLGDKPQYFGDFQIIDSNGRTLAKDDFSGPDGAIPTGWKCVSGGPNPIKPGIGGRIDGIGWHPGGEPNAAYFAAVREFQKQCRDLGFKGHFFATELYAGSMYPPGVVEYPRLASEVQMGKYLVRSLVGHSGVGMEAGPCHTHFTGRVHPQALCQTNWGTPTLNPCRPTVAYYMWRNVATVMDDFHPSDFAVNFSDGRRLLYFTFRRGSNERMVSVWIDEPSKDGIVEASTDIVFPGMQATSSVVVDIMNGTEQDLHLERSGADTVLKGMLIKDYPVFVRINQ